MTSTRDERTWRSTRDERALACCGRYVARLHRVVLCTWVSMLFAWAVDTNVLSMHYPTNSVMQCLAFTSLWSIQRTFPAWQACPNVRAEEFEFPTLTLTPTLTLPSWVHTRGTDRPPDLVSEGLWIAPL